MDNEIRTGVYICHCGENIAGTVDVEKVAEYALGLDPVVVARHYMFMCSEPGQELIKNDIKEIGLNRVVVASCSPRMHQLTFRRTCQEGGLNPYLYEQANIREHCSWVHRDRGAATEKAKDLIRAAVRRVYHHDPLEIKEAPVNPNTLIVGGGIAGISAALKIAASEHKVYLVEREPSIGGHMIQFDVTFPTLDCPECIMTPKMTDVGSHDYIELMAYSEVEEVSGYIGNFKVKIRKRARYVNDKCTACGDCVKNCPVEVLSEFDEGLSKRKAIYIPFAQAIPHKYIIDRRGISPCQNACPAGVRAQGYIALISQGKFKEALEVVRRVLPFPSVCGRVCHHPCEDQCNRKEVEGAVSIQALKKFIADFARENGEEAVEAIKPSREENIAIIGAGPSGLTCVLRLLEIGYGVTIIEASDKPGGMIVDCIPDYRIPKEIANYDIARVLAHGIELKTNTKVGRDVTLEQLRKEYKAIYIAIGAQEPTMLPIEGTEAKGVLYGLTLLRDVKAGRKVKELGQKVIIIGGGNVAIDCAKLARRLDATEVHLVCLETRDLSSKDRMPAHEWEIEEAEEEGIIIHPSLGPKRIVSKDGKFTGLETVVCTSVYDEDGRFVPEFAEGPGPTIEGDTVIIAIGQRADLTGFDDLELTPRRTIKVDEITLETSIPGIFAGGDIARGPASVIEAVAHGNEAAISIDRFLNGVDLKEGRRKEVKIAPLPEGKIEKKERAELPKRAPKERVRDFGEIELGLSEKEALEAANRCLNCAVCSDCRECEKPCEAKAIDYDMQDEVVEVEVGSIIIATGYDAFDPGVIPQYGYGRYDNIITALEFERLSCATGPTGGEILLKDGRKPESVAIIHCVGSRDENYHEYCSRVCCMYALKDAHLLREKTGAEVYEMYIDMRCFGEGYEEFYKRLSEEGIHFIRGKVAKVTDQAMAEEEEGKLVVICEDTLLGSMLRVPVDMVILCIALEPRSDAEQVARLFNINRRQDGFFQETHLKLDPIATPTGGVFLIGCSQGPKDITDTVGQALGGAGEALALIGKGKVTLEAAIAESDETLCIGCGRCEEVCEYHAPTISKDERVIPVCVVNEVLCKGCGACAVACPTGAMSVRHFTRDEVLSMVDAFLEV